jgi:23S rRNA pseudouridine1911/1915/1917 synthase
MTIETLYEDKYLLVIDKPVGVIVHEGAGNAAHDTEDREERTSVLTDWIKETHPQIVEAFAQEEDLYFRPGIVHRLDKDTSGLLVIAKTPEMKTKLQALFKERSVSKQYTALVLGRPEPTEGTIATHISRDPHHRRQMAVSFVGKGKEATTDYRTVTTWHYPYKGQRLAVSLVNITLHSGRMHQIRVHMKYKGWPVIGDQTYQTKPSRNISKELDIDRQFLHAHQLAFTHPETGETIEVLSPLPGSLQRVIDTLEEKELS